MVVENRYVRKSGAPIWVRKSLSVVRGADQAPEWIIVLIEDITARKQSEELAKAKDASDEANRQKDQFLATLGHELRNPLSGIRNVVDLMKRWSPVEPRWQRARDLIDGQLTHMTRLIDDLLDVSRVAMGKIVLQKEKLDLVALVRTTVEDHRTQVDAVGLQMELVAPTAPLWVYGDATRLAQLVSNLLVNACKFTDRGGRVTVALQSDSAGSAELTVHDTGIGMDAATLEAVFSPFAQADRSLARSQGGLGLGLALVRGLAELHDGAVSCSSPGLGRGSEFRVCLPLSSTEGAEGDEAGAPPELPAPHEPPQRVLIIEDNVVAADSLKTLLEMAGHSVTVAHTGREGIRQAREHRPDTVLCDVGLPGGMDGYAVARALRADPELASVYLIAMTGYGQEEDRRRAKAAGFDVHLTKPADVVTVRRLLAR
jgi:signal transduction histidine kinase/CheY-like chemotaxis protein